MWCFREFTLKELLDNFQKSWEAKDDILGIHDWQTFGEQLIFEIKSC